MGFTETKKQRCVALSSCEAEFMAATAAACQGMWLHRLLSQISDVKTGPVVIYIDNTPRTEVLLTLGLLLAV